MNSATKQIIIAIVIIIVAFVGYQMFFVSGEAGDTSLTPDIQTQNQFIDGQVILGLLNKLDRVTLDESIFSNNIFMSLQSFERVLEGQVSGRKNPFLPIGVENYGAVVSKSTSTIAR